MIDDATSSCSLVVLDCQSCGSCPIQETPHGPLLHYDPEIQGFRNNSKLLILLLQIIQLLAFALLKFSQSMQMAFPCNIRLYYLRKVLSFVLKRRLNTTRGGQGEQGE